MEINLGFFVVVIVIFGSMQVGLSLATWFIVKDEKTRGVLYSHLVLISLFLAVLWFMDDTHLWLAVFQTIIAMFYGILAILGIQNGEKEDESDEDSNVSCPNCGALNEIAGPSMTNCAYCGGNLA